MPLGASLRASLVPRLAPVLFAAALWGCAKPSVVTPGGGCPAGTESCGGACVDKSSDVNNCGACGNACTSGQQCQSGACQCLAGLTACGTACVSLVSDPMHCGSCTNACSGGQVCNQRSCASTCSSGLMNCSGACVNVSGNDALNCGSCGHQCPAGQACTNGSCGCPTAGQMVCGANCVDVTTNAANCGGCNKVCGATQVCSNSMCQCPSGQTTCPNGTCAPSTAQCGGGGGSGGSTGTGGAAGGTTGTGGAGGSGGSNGGGGVGGSIPPGYWIYKPASGAYQWNGCAWTGIDTVTVAPHRTTIMPTDFVAQAGTSGPYHVSGSVGQDINYNGVALLGFNLNQGTAGASCIYNPAAASSVGPPGVTFPAGPTGIAVNFSKTAATGVVRIQIQGPNGATDPNNRWCFGLTAVQGKDFAPFNRFFTQCFNDDGTGHAITGKSLGNPYMGEPISAIAFLVPGTNNADLPYDITVNGFALGTSAADAPDGGTAGVLSGTIGGADPSGGTNSDFQRVKVTGGNPQHSYIIQNNNWGNPGGTDQTITYSNNSFKITAETGGDLGGGSVRAFPSIYVGANGNTMAGAYSTIADDNLPKQVSAIQSAMTTFTWSGGVNNGNYNATYDVWFAATAPNKTSFPTAAYPQYCDAISGFIMVWLYKPGANNPIGGSPAHTNVTVPGVSGMWNVYIGPRSAGSAPPTTTGCVAALDSNRPVVSYVATGKLNTLTFDLKNFITHAVTNGYGIQNAWYLTDVFAGFEIWTGSDAVGLQATTFTMDVK